MRELKFRAWNGEEMIYLQNVGLQYFDFEGSYALSFVVDGYNEFWAHEQYNSASKRAALFPIMQWTGLIDNNKIDIYEGDIMNYGGNDNKQIIFLAGSFGVLNIGSGGNSFGSYRIDDGLIIGNIYQNPELIK